MHHIVTEMSTYVHISVIKWCIVGFLRQVYCALAKNTTQISNKFVLVQRSIEPHAPSTQMDNHLIDWAIGSSTKIWSLNDTL